MRAILRILSVLTVSGIVISIGGAASAETPSAGTGDTAYGGCSAFSVEAAPSGEKDAKGKPIVPTPAAGGKWVPVILVHGWTGGPDNFDGATNLFGDGGDGGAPIDFKVSLSGRLQSIPGVMVYRFDYHEYASRWVTDGNIGPRLADAIECLTDHYGQKAALVAHSMGGLAARFALAQHDAKGQLISSRVSQVHTFGTPNTGSDIAAAVAQIGGKSTDAFLSGRGGLAQGVLVAAWTFVQVCGREATQGASQVTGACAALPPYVTSIDSEAGKALRTGSAELAALPQWPSGLNVSAVKGTISLRGVSLFGAALDSDPSINIGDLPVSNTSAVSGATTSFNDPCSLEVLGRRGSLEYVPDGDIKGGALTLSKLMESPCFHGNLMRTLNGVNPVVQSIRSLAGAPMSTSSTQPSTAAAPSSFATAGPGWYRMTRSDRVRDGELNAYTDAQDFSIQAKTYAYGFYNSGSYMGYDFDTKEDGIDFSLGGRCSRMQFDLGIWARAETTTSVSDAKVLIDGRPALESKIGYYSQPLPVDLDVTGATRIRISNGWDSEAMRPPSLALGEPRVYCTSDPFN
ncbi:NPCBM/NEW2 domain-containing protein [Paenarthrobacter aromaticivorans]|uniref:NPCBM/NEW2 domain-containing protein n=1 Tax=Paenarthrobacter aromaticivorans TaxID=2849150 RepID=UPI003A810F8E